MPKSKLSFGNIIVMVCLLYMFNVTLLVFILPTFISTPKPYTANSVEEELLVVTNIALDVYPMDH